MNKLNILLLSIVSFILLASCGDNDDIKGPSVYPPDAVPVEVSFRLSLKGKVEPIKDPETGEVLVNLSTNMDDVTTLILVVHDGLTGEITKNVSFVSSKIAEMKNKEGDYILKTTLDPGRYNVTLIACQGGRTLGPDDYKPLNKNYERAVCNIPMSFIFYDSFPMEELKSGEVYSKPKDVVMNQQTKAVFTYKLNDWKDLKLPEGTNPQIVAKGELTGLHSAFFIGYKKKGQVLTSEDYKSYENDEQLGPIVKPHSAIFAYSKPNGTIKDKLEIWLPILDNKNLKEAGELGGSELGEFRFTAVSQVNIEGGQKSESLFGKDAKLRVFRFAKQSDDQAFESFFVSDATSKLEPDEVHTSLPK